LAVGMVIFLGWINEYLHFHLVILQVDLLF